MTATLSRTASDHDEAIRREYPGLLAYCRQLDWHAPEDLAQEAAARTCKRLTTAEIDDLGAYLRTTARHIRDDMVRLNRRRGVAVPMAEPDAGGIEDPDVADRLALSEGLRLALSGLKSHELEVLRLADIEERPIEWIAARTGASVASTTSLLYRTRQKVRADLLRMRRRGALLLSGPAAFFRQLFQVVNPEVLGAAAAAGVAAVAVLVGGSQPQTGTMVGESGSVERIASGLLAQGPAQQTPLVRPEALEPPPATARFKAAPGEAPSGRPPEPPLLSPRSPEPNIFDDGRTHVSGDRPVTVEVGPNCTHGVFGLESDPWTEDLGFLFNGNPPPGSELVRAQVYADSPQPICDLQHQGAS